MEWKVSFHRMNSFYISLLTMKSSIAFGTVYSEQHPIGSRKQICKREVAKYCKSRESILYSNTFLGGDFQKLKYVDTDRP
jgi:hypothetical protein